MFCPGLSLDAAGRPVVTGGKSESRTSIYDEINNRWISGPEMIIGRGYHAQVTLSDGRIFTIGGSWSGVLAHERGKSGEVYDPQMNAWSQLQGCAVEPMLTKDRRGMFAADNHAWLFAWKNSSVFQAGPSNAMNWYDTDGVGRQIAAGTRGEDLDSMSGNAVMFDATQGKILTLGGSTSYSAAYGSKAAHVITLAESFGVPTVTAIGDMGHLRVYANSVILPTGDVFVNGGSSYAMQWTDANATRIPEMWNPTTQLFTPMARMPIPRTYHSTAILLPDATVLTGGGGLCWGACQDDNANHFDIQIFTPPYLFNVDGTKATRPRIVNLSSTTAEPGDILEIITDAEVEGYAMIRYGSATHSINTDQRRVAGKFDKTPDKLYTVNLPNDSGVLIPGYWMVFVIDGRGVPSISRTIRIQSL